MKTVTVAAQPASSWPKRIGRLILLALALLSLGLAAALLFFTLIVLVPAWDGGIESLFVWWIAILGLPLLAVQFMFGIILLLPRKRLAPLRLATALSALATLVSVGILAGVVGYYVHSARLSGEADANDAATLADLRKAVQAGDAKRAGTLLDDMRVRALLTGHRAANLLGLAIDRKDRPMLALILEKCPSLARTACPAGEAGPLHRAAAAGDVEIVRLLVEKGFALDAADAAGKTPLDYARAGHHAETAKLLEESAPGR